MNRNSHNKLYSNRNNNRRIDHRPPSGTTRCHRQSRRYRGRTPNRRWTRHLRTGTFEECNPQCIAVYRLIWDNGSRKGIVRSRTSPLADPQWHDNLRHHDKLDSQPVHNTLHNQHDRHRIDRTRRSIPNLCTTPKNRPDHLIDLVHYFPHSYNIDDGSSLARICNTLLNNT